MKLDVTACTHSPPVTWEAEAGGSVESRSTGLAEATQ